MSLATFPCEAPTETVSAVRPRRRKEARSRSPASNQTGPPIRIDTVTCQSAPARPKFLVAAMCSRNNCVIADRGISIATQHLSLSYRSGTCDPVALPEQPAAQPQASTYAYACTNNPHAGSLRHYGRVLKRLPTRESVFLLSNMHHAC